MHCPLRGFAHKRLMALRAIPAHENAGFCRAMNQQFTGIFETSRNQAKLPSSAEEGRAEAKPAGVVFANKLNRLTSTTPALVLRLRPIGLALRGATPPQPRRGASL